MKKFVFYIFMIFLCSRVEASLIWSNDLYRNVYGGGSLGLNKQFYCQGLNMQCDGGYNDLFRFTNTGGFIGIPGIAGMHLPYASQYGANPFRPNLWGQRGQLNPAWSMIPWAEAYMPRVGTGRSSRSSRSARSRVRSRSRSSDRSSDDDNSSSTTDISSIQVVPVTVSDNDPDTTGGNGDRDAVEGVDDDAAVTILSDDLTEVPVEPQGFFPSPIDNSFVGGCDERLNQFYPWCSGFNLIDPVTVTELDDKCMTPSDYLKLNSSEGEHCPQCYEVIQKIFNSADDFSKLENGLTCLADGTPGAFYKDIYKNEKEPCIETAEQAKVYACISKSLDQSKAISTVIQPTKEGSSCEKLSDSAETAGSCNSHGSRNAIFNAFESASQCLNVDRSLLYKVVNHESRFNLNAVLYFDEGSKNTGEAGLGQVIPSAMRTALRNNLNWVNSAKCQSLKSSLNAYYKTIEDKPMEPYQCSMVSGSSSEGGKANPDVSKDPALKQMLSSAALLSYYSKEWDKEWTRKDSSKCNEDFGIFSAAQKAEMKNRLVALSYNRGKGAMFETCAYIKYLRNEIGVRTAGAVDGIMKNNIAVGGLKTLANFYQDKLGDRSVSEVDDYWRPVLSKRLRLNVIRHLSNLNTDGKNAKINRVLNILKDNRKAAKFVYDEKGVPDLTKFGLSKSDQNLVRPAFEHIIIAYKDKNKDAKNNYYKAMSNSDAAVGDQCEFSF